MLSFARASASEALYVPSAMVSLGADGLDLLHVHGLAVTGVEVDLQLSNAGTFKFTIPNTFDPGRAEFLTARGQPALPLLKLGTRVWIRMGYGDRARQPLLLAGYITAVGTSFAEGGSPDLEVSGQDALYPLTLGSKERKIDQGGIRAAVQQVAADYRLTLKLGGDPPDIKNPDSNLQNDMQFLAKLAESFAKDGGKWEFYARPEPTSDVLHFRPRTEASEVAVLKWGADLLSFKPEANLGNQISRVEVHGWDEVRKKAILGEARAQGGPGMSPGDLQQAFLPQEVVRQLRLPVRSKEEADARAAAELAKTLNDHLKGEGETFGMTTLLPDTRVRLDGLGAKFSRSFYVTKTTHRYDSSGYRTRFSIEEPTS
jgi:hypothetical protein